MNRILTAAFLCMAMSPALAQSTTPATNDASTPAVTTTDKNNAGAPVKGANSFTEAQAKSHIEAKGYTNVMNLAKDQDGIWRGKGTKDGTAHDVALDYQGNVFGK